MANTAIEVHDELNKQSNMLRYLAEVEDKLGLSELLLEIAMNLAVLKHSECLKIEKGVEGGKEDFE